jgi:serum/glucocorticoid-regulated kinase 2
VEIVEGVEGLYTVGVIYWDLKPENMLIGRDRHVVFIEFGPSKEFPRRSVPVTTAPGTWTGGSLPLWMKKDEELSSCPGWQRAHTIAIP